MTTEKIKKIDEALKLHIDYDGMSSAGRYLRVMDELASNYSGTRGIALSSMLDDYYKKVGVTNLKEAFQRIRDLNKTA